MDRPRRSTRQPVKGPLLVAADVPPSSKPKRKVVAEVDPEKLLKALLQSSKSDLVSLDMTNIISGQTWAMLSDDARTRLKTLVPPTAFVSYRETIGDDHPCLEIVRPSKADADADGMLIEDDKTLDELRSAFFTDSHFLAAMRTFQDQLYLNWFTDVHQKQVRQFQEGIRAGNLAAPWKDEVWERENCVPELDIRNLKREGSLSHALAGGASEVKLSTLVQKDIIRIGDILAYKRSFATSEVIEKDCIVQATSGDSLTILTPAGTTKDLATYLLTSPPSSSPSDLPVSQHPRSMMITSPSMLETGILDLDGRMEKSRRPNGNAWKCFSVWRWRAGGEGYNPYDTRGGRENHGTLFYLRGSYYHER